MRDAVPFFQASSAATRCSVLSNEYRVSPEWGLFAVIGDDGGYQAFADEILSMCHDDVQPFATQSGQLFASQVETAAKGRFVQGVEQLVQISHGKLF